MPALNTQVPYTLGGHCGCSKDEPNCYVERRNNGLYKTQGRCGGTNCSRQFDAEWMKAAHADCSAILGCSARCQIPPICSGSCCHDFWRCVPEYAEKASVACTVRSYSAADAKCIQAACMKLKTNRTSIAAYILPKFMHMLLIFDSICLLLNACPGRVLCLTRMHLLHLCHRHVCVSCSSSPFHSASRHSVCYGVEHRSRNI